MYCIISSPTADLHRRSRLEDEFYLVILHMTWSRGTFPVAIMHERTSRVARPIAGRPFPPAGPWSESQPPGYPGLLLRESEGRPQYKLVENCPTNPAHNRWRTNGKCGIPFFHNGCFGGRERFLYDIARLLQLTRGIGGTLTNVLCAVCCRREGEPVCILTNGTDLALRRRSNVCSIVCIVYDK